MHHSAMAHELLLTPGLSAACRLAQPQQRCLPQETSIAELASEGTELSAHLNIHMSGQQQLDANTKNLSMLHLSFQLGTWGAVVDPIQMAELAQLGAQRILPSMW